MLDALIQDGLRRWVAGIGQDGALAERARARLGRSLIQAKYAILGDDKCHQIGDFLPNLLVEHAAKGNAVNFWVVR